MRSQTSLFVMLWLVIVVVPPCFLCINKTRGIRALMMGVFPPYYTDCKFAEVPVKSITSGSAVQFGSVFWANADNSAVFPSSICFPIIKTVAHGCCHVPLPTINFATAPSIIIHMNFVKLCIWENFISLPALNL